jgi:dephospho-CoA kinase
MAQGATSSGSAHSPYRVGLTGGIASGKTTVGRLFAALGVPLIDTDEIARELVAPGTALLARLVERFGRTLVLADGTLDRRALRTLVFADPAARAALDAMTHPLILAETARRARAAGGRYQLLAIPLLVEHGGRRGLVDRVLVVDCPEELQLRRVQARDGSSREEAAAILAAQAPRATRLAAADDVIVNDSDLQHLRHEVERLHALYLALAAAASGSESP